MKVAIGVVRRGPRRRHRRRGHCHVLGSARVHYFTELKVRSHAFPLNEFCTPFMFVDV
jgi:hypothetical protein